MLACLAAGLTFILLVEGPALSAGVPGASLSLVGNLVLIATVGFAVFAALPALLGVILGEARGITSWMFYALARIFIATAGVLYRGLGWNYALTAGLAGGLVYSFVRGRFAGG